MQQLNELKRQLFDLPEVTEETPFGPEVLVYKVCNKLFALTTWEERPLRVNLKCEPAESLILQDEYAAINPGYHMNKRHWITVTLDGSLPDDLIEELIRNSYELVVKGLKRADRTRIQRFL